MFGLDHTGKVYTTPVPAEASAPAAQLSPWVESASGIRVLINTDGRYIYALDVHMNGWKSRTSGVGIGDWCRADQQC
jgi:hypothetical protein